MELLAALSDIRRFHGIYLWQSVVHLDHMHTGQWMPRRLRSSGNRQARAPKVRAASSRATTIPRNLAYIRRQAFLFIVSVGNLARRTPANSLP